MSESYLQCYIFADNFLLVFHCQFLQKNHYVKEHSFRVVANGMFIFVIYVAKSR